MTSSLSAARNALQTIRKDADKSNLNVTDGISLLSLKHHVLLSYLQSLVLVTSHRLVGNSLEGRSPPSEPFGTKERTARGNFPGDLVDSMIENRIVLEKAEVLESKMRYQIEKLVRLSDETSQKAEQAVVDDPLAFKPNPMALMQSNEEPADEGGASAEKYDPTEGDGIYRPPRLAPMPYVEKSKNKSRRERPPVPSALSNLIADPSKPYMETTSGLGGTPGLQSGRAQYLKRVKDFEEENFTRLVMKKSEARQRARDEEDLALGGDLGGGTSSRGRRRAGGLEDEFGDVLRSVSRVTGGRSQGDGYEELRQRGKKMDILSRSRGESRKRDADADDEVIDAPRMKKRSRFELETKVAKKKLAKRRPTN
ncbi:hypothetical protein CPC08DRAFT_733008 [Agrocybe pediades]|nr:hypothetical protein CPC08DRAFT_733008 [Agrocybe pediades]